MNNTVYTQSQLIELIKMRNQHAFAYLYNNYSKALFGVIIKIVPEQADAEDVLQNSFLKIWENFNSFDETKGRLYTWLLNICRNAAIDFTRSRHQKIKNKIQTTTDSVYINTGLIVEDKKHDTIGINAVLTQLTNEQQLLINLAYYKGYTQIEIAKILNLPLGTVKTKTRQAILTLRNITKEKKTRTAN